MASSSSDSDASERVRNLRSVLVKLEDSHKESNSYAYKKRLGDLIFNANFETGNLCGAERVDLFDYNLMVRPDVANPRHTMWFNFTVSNQLLNQCIVFTFVNLSSILKLFHEGLTPVVRSKQKPNWVRLHEDQVFYHKSSNHDERLVLSIAFRFSSYDNEHQFALFYPYSYSMLSNFISRWRVELLRTAKSCRKPLNSSSTSDSRLPAKFRSNSRRTLHRSDDVVFNIDTIGTSVLCKPIFLLSMRSSVENVQRARVITICGWNGNMNAVASLVCQGMMDYILCDDRVASLTRSKIEFIFLPMLDPDSISAGNSSTDIFGQTNYSRKFLDANQNLYSNVRESKRLVKKFCSRDGRTIVIELKVNLGLIGSRVVGTNFNDCNRMERHLSWPRLLSHYSEGFYLEKCEFNSNLSRNLSSFFINDDSKLDIDQYILEVSPFAYHKRSLDEYDFVEYDQLKYLSMGKAVIYSLCELVKSREISLIQKAASALSSFKPTAHDIDDLLLDLKERNVSGNGSTFRHS